MQTHKRQAVWVAVAGMTIVPVVWGDAYSYSTATSATNYWSTGLNWRQNNVYLNQVPVSSQGTVLEFKGALNTNSGQLINSWHDIGGASNPFKLNMLTLATSTSAHTSIYNISPASAATNTLRFMPNAGVAPAVNLNGNAYSSGKLTYTVSINASIDGPLAFKGNGTAAFVYSGSLADGTSVASITKRGNSTLTLSGNNSFTGPFSIREGTVVFSNWQALGGSPSRLSISSGGTMVAGYVLDQATLDRIEATSAGVVSLSSDHAGALNFSSLPGLSLGAAGTVTYSGSLTPAGATYRLGGGGGNLIYTPSLSGEGTKLVAGGGGGTVTLASAGTYGGGTLVSGHLAGCAPGAAQGAMILQTADIASNAPFGSGGITLRNGTLGIGTTGLSSGQAQSISGYDLRVEGSGTIKLARGLGTEATFSASSLTRVGRSVLALSPSNTGTVTAPTSVNLGGSERVIFTSGAPTMTRGMVDPHFVNNTTRFFLAYDAASGFVSASPTRTIAGAMSAASLSPTDIVENTAPVALSGGTSASVHAIRFTNNATSGATDTLGAGKTLSVGSGGVIFNSNNSGSFYLTGNLDFGSAEGVIGCLNAGVGTPEVFLQGDLRGSGGVTKYGAGTVKFFSYSFTGGLTIVSGNALCTTAGLMDNSNSLTVHRGATFDLGATDCVFDLAVSSLAGNGLLTQSYASTGATLTISGDAATPVATFGGEISEGVATSGPNLVKAGASRQVFTGVNTYRGSTTISGGILEITGDGSINASSSIILNGGELKYNSSVPLASPVTFSSGRLSGSGALATALSLPAGATLAPGNSIGILSSGSLAFTGGTYEAEVDAESADLLQITGNLSIGEGSMLNLVCLDPAAVAPSGTKLTLIRYSGSWDGGAFFGYGDDSVVTLGASAYLLDYNDGGALTLTAIPEPATFGLAAVLGPLLGRRRRSR